MKILLVHPHLIAGGAERLLLYLAQYLNKRHEVAICTLSLEENLPDFSKGLNFIVPKKMRRFGFLDGRVMRYVYTVKTIMELRKLVKSVTRDYELLNPHNFPAPLACVKRDNSVVWNCNESPGFFGNQFELNQSPLSNTFNGFLLSIEKSLTRKTIDEICVLSKLAGEIIEKQYHKSTHVVYPGVDYEFYSNGRPKHAVERFKLHDSFIVLQVGQITYQKNQMASILAIEGLIDTIPNIKLVIAGRGENSYSVQLKEQITLKGLERYVCFTGAITDDDVRNLYHACDVNIFPTRLQSFGLAPLEGLCANKIPVVSPLCGVSSLIKEYNIGIVSNDLVEPIQEIYKNPEQFRPQISRGNKIVKELLTWETFSKGVEELFLKYEKK